MTLLRSECPTIDRDKQVDGYAALCSDSCFRMLLLANVRQTKESI